ncbi:accessory gland protein Acp29AB-like [Drosophila ananassae]|uniref:accessory gland protein Acp29AB-like n=1 Tax=Drosophila ananassae TaxID=7217 RepID=UPI0013A5C14E|nr:accessory gland protein Acp29AB-like [Drosophila ananassae]
MQYVNTQPRICGGKFKAIGSKCYYIEHDKAQYWISALYQCSRLGGHLASIQSQQELDDISKELMHNSQYFIDLNDLNLEQDNFISATTGVEPSYKHKNLEDENGRKGILPFGT